MWSRLVREVKYEPQDILIRFPPPGFKKAFSYFLFSRTESQWSTRMGTCGPVSSAAKLLPTQKPKWDFFTQKILSSLTRYKFLHQANLKRHTETHIKGIPWPCNICGKVSGSKSGLAQHKAKYHKDQESAMVAVKVILVKISIHLFHILSLHIAVLYFSVTWIWKYRNTEIQKSKWQYRDHLHSWAIN